MHKELHFLFANDLLQAHTFKIHFEYCAGECDAAETLEEKVAIFQREFCNKGWHILLKWNDGWMEQYITSLDRVSPFLILFSFFLNFLLLLCIIYYY